ncbi:polysaccharide biosynthesis/export family protein [Gelidibacter salicanalis]|uniref:Polysaccharide biosynthesis/export family protein n=1 Tax=Gelidibacter salicanalis TaxID=291193 RepID=A0A934NHQ0_9FLAO|nr:polysaccharide biosynthesis/export family protein [Gelidibacter salicanalis]MBJ7879149.1 polysaccharide biosynthesis/export family protein [Gelidibacter salicanalis]
MKYPLLLVLALFFLNSCATKKEILYFQDAAQYNNTPISYVKPILQPNDILKITVGALLEETAKPYNRVTSGGSGGGSSDLMKLDGYLVSEQHTISFPQLGTLSTANKTTRQMEEEITLLLENGGHLKNPTVNVRLLNPKVTVLGEVGGPGTYSFTEESITLLQALGMAGDLTINGRREDILVIRETDGVYKTTTIDVTSADLLTSPYYFIKPNDVIIVNPNGPTVKSAGYIGNLGSLFSVISIVLSTVILITR